MLKRLRRVLESRTGAFAGKNDRRTWVESARASVADEVRRALNHYILARRPDLVATPSMLLPRTVEAANNAWRRKSTATPSPSIEGTCSGRLRPPTQAPHVKP